MAVPGWPIKVQGTSVGQYSIYADPAMDSIHLFCAHMSPY